MKSGRGLAYPLALGSSVRLQGRIKECAELIDSGDRLLDIGCSSGWLADVALRKGYHHYVGVDRLIHGPRRNENGAAFVEGSVLDLPFRSESFDAVCLFDVIEHLPRASEDRALREAHRVLSRGGRLYFSVPYASAIHAPLDPVWMLGHRHYPRAKARRLLERAGFNVDRMFVAGGTIEALDHIRLLVYKHVLRRQRPQVGWIDRMIERSHGRDHRLGMSLFVVASRC